LFADNRYFVTGNEDYACEWVGEMTIQGIDNMGDESMWLGYAISLSLLETTCYDMDPWVWGETTPTTAMESAFLGVGYGPLSPGLASSLKSLINLSGDSWEQNWEPYLFAMHLGVWNPSEGRLVPQEVGFALSYEMADGALTSALDETPVPIPLDSGGTPPEGLLIAYPWTELDPASFL
jgi:hypothetical protein